MTDAAQKEHLNLFYIFQEDKKENALPEEKANKIWQALLSASEGRPPT